LTRSRRSRIQNDTDGFNIATTAAKHPALLTRVKGDTHQSALIAPRKFATHLQMVRIIEERGNQKTG
jgi:hypothetical protein